MILFFVGVLEMLIVACWTKVVSETQVLMSGAITVVNVFIWYFVLNQVLEDLNNFSIIIMYALGCAVGTMIATYLFNIRDKKKVAKKARKSLEAQEALKI
ncbi:MAG: DUF5698 domain-containing protein [Patescibacteria group bacterium]